MLMHPRHVRNFLLLMALVMSAPLMARISSAQERVVADVVYHNGFVYTVDDLRSQADAFAVKDGKIVAVGSNDEMKAFTGPNTKSVDLGGKIARTAAVRMQLLHQLSMRPADVIMRSA